MAFTSAASRHLRTLRPCVRSSDVKRLLTRHAAMSGAVASPASVQSFIDDMNRKYEQVRAELSSTRKGSAGVARTRTLVRPCACDDMPRRVEGRRGGAACVKDHHVFAAGSMYCTLVIFGVCMVSPGVARPVGDKGGMRERPCVKWRRCI
eukprot:363193-Chlamydomonas_euryale.AAC.6